MSKIEKIETDIPYYKAEDLVKRIYFEISDTVNKGYYRDLSGMLKDMNKDAVSALIGFIKHLINERKKVAHQLFKAGYIMNFSDYKNSINEKGDSLIKFISGFVS